MVERLSSMSDNKHINGKHLAACLMVSKFAGAVSKLGDKRRLLAITVLFELIRTLEQKCLFLFVIRSHCDLP